MAKSVQIGKMLFATKKAAKDYIRDIISRYPVKSSLDTEDLLFVSDLLTIHPESEQKIGSGISRIIVDLDAQYGKNKCFYVGRNDGSSTDFSWVSCIDGRNRRREIFDAFRNAVNEQIETFRSEQLASGASCPYTGEALHNGNSHIDHKSPQTFYALVNDFIENEAIELLDVKISEPQDNQFTTVLIDEQFADRWWQYHSDQANLRILSQTGNLSHAKKS